MSSPYSPPKAAVDDVGVPPALPRWVRVLRGVAVAGSVSVAGWAVPLAMVVPPSQRTELKFLLLTTGIVLVGAVSILALTSQIAPRLAFWSALAVNGATLAFFCYLALNRPGRNPEIALLFILPALINFAALEVLRRARLKQRLG